MGEKIVESILEVKAVAGLDPRSDLTLEDGKSIAELLDEQKEEKEDPAPERE